jgi:hypothetical protein
MTLANAVRLALAVLGALGSALRDVAAALVNNLAVAPGIASLFATDQ